ncbi:F0F1 ATP synthase subunit delta [uncultured Thiohalocapsa sp.]|uniref:F0F1 ATP synthase subunit delta n=1 Tax=uncultured Thiohalocapsa sp. TaxID=768990 RepID=UPI0025E4C9E7|nr:F0F1 ATP synthase subunit delta [uncultured Thiohalocapsa sp.]
MAGDTTTIARPYAEAAFEVAKAEGALDAWADGLSLLGAIADDAQIAAQVGNPHASSEQLRDLIFGVAGEGLNAHLQNLVRLLARNKRLSVLPDIARLFAQMKTLHDGLQQIQITSAYPVGDAERDELIERLKAHFGGDVHLTIDEDPDLIGGVKVRAGDVVIDGSVRGKLERLSNDLQF